MPLSVPVVLLKMSLQECVKNYATQSPFLDYQNFGDPKHGLRTVVPWYYTKSYVYISMS